MVYFTILDPNLCTRFGLNTIRIVTYSRMVDKKRNSESMEDNIDKIRRYVIVEIKNKIGKNPGYLHPCNKERQEDMKRLKFTNGYEFTCWMQQNGIMKNPTNIDRKEWEKRVEYAGCKTKKEYRDKCAQKAGFKDFNERNREWLHETGRNLPKEFNEDCSSYFGDFAESLMIQTFEDATRMPYGNPGYDWTCKRGDKIDNKGACLVYTDNKCPRWLFPIEYNNVADWFILSAWDNRCSLNPLHVWAFHKNDMVRYRAMGALKKFCDRETFAITNTPEKLKEFGKYEVTNRLDKLKELCNTKR